MNCLRCGKVFIRDVGYLNNILYCNQCEPSTVMPEQKSAFEKPLLVGILHHKEPLEQILEIKNLFDDSVDVVVSTGPNGIFLNVPWEIKAKTGTASDNRNNIIEHAIKNNYKYIMFVDSDDVPLNTDRLESICLQYEEDLIVARLELDLRPLGGGTETEDAFGMLANFHSKLYKADFLKKTGCRLIENPAEDVDFNWRLMTFGPSIRVLDDILFRHIWRANSVTSDARVDFQEIITKKRRNIDYCTNVILDVAYGDLTSGTSLVGAAVWDDILNGIRTYIKKNYDDFEQEQIFGAIDSKIEELCWYSLIEKHS